MDLLRGVVHGKTIELESESGLPDGQRVTVAVQPMAQSVESLSRAPLDEGLRRAFGAWAEDGEELDRYLAWSRQQRKVSRPELEP
jgi:hypothetical protein